MTEELAFREVAEDPDVERAVVEPRLRGDGHADAGVRAVRYRHHERPGSDRLVVELDRHPRRAVAEGHPDRPQNRPVVAAIEVLGVAEHGGVHPHRARLVERLVAGRAHVDGTEEAIRQDGCRGVDVAWQPQHARDVHDAAERQDAERRLAAEQLVRDHRDRPVTAGRDDEVVPVANRFTRQPARVGLGVRRDERIREAVTSQYLAELLLAHGIRRDPALAARLRVPDDARATPARRDGLARDAGGRGGPHARGSTRRARRRPPLTRR